jgi:SAM-dependent methyltransferase
LKKDQDAYGEQLLAQFNSKTPTAEIIEREDNYLDFGSDPGHYFTEYKKWSEPERRAIKQVKGRILDVGCGAGRHSLYLQQKGFDVTGIDNSPGAIKVCKLRGLKKALVRPIEEIDKFKPNSFDTVLMMGNNFGLFGSQKKARLLLKKFARITSPGAKIIAGTLDPYQTTDPDHLLYQKQNRKRGRMSGQIRFRVRYKKTVGKWFDYLLVSPAEMQDILKGTDWQVKEFIGSENPNYLAILSKK